MRHTPAPTHLRPLFSTPAVWKKFTDAWWTLAKQSEVFSRDRCGADWAELDGTLEAAAISTCKASEKDIANAREWWNDLGERLGSEVHLAVSHCRRTLHITP